MTSPTELEEFEFQLRAQREFAAEQPAPGASDARSYVDPNDGTVYEWDSEKNGWFPKIDDDFLAAYQASYGLDNTASTEATPTGATPTEATPTSATPTGATRTNLQTTAESSVAATGTGDDEKERGATKGAGDGEGSGKDGTAADTRKRKQEPGWFDIDDSHNHNVYVSGLPFDFTVDEFSELMGKCGIVANDEKGEPKLKLYSDINGQLKGDGLCCYLKVESVDLAIQLLDQSNHRGHTITVERAKFRMKGEYNPTIKKKKKKGKKRGGQERLLDWRERNFEGPKTSRSKYDKVVIFKHLFQPKEFEEDPMAINDIRDDLRQECEKFGVVKKILLFDRHPDGVASVAFKEFEAADLCVLQMNRRWYGGKQLDVCTWDGATNYQIEETDQEREQRIQQWEKFLEEGGVGAKEGGAEPEEGRVKPEEGGAKNGTDNSSVKQT